MRTFAPKGNVYGPIMPRYVFKMNLSQGAKIMYSYLCNLAGCSDHCWPSNKTISDEIGSCESSVKNYIRELTNEKLIEVRITQHKRDIFILIPEGAECGLNIDILSKNSDQTSVHITSTAALQAKADSDLYQPIFAPPPAKNCPHK